MATFWATFSEFWVAFYSDIWSHSSLSKYLGQFVPVRDLSLY